MKIKIKDIFLPKDALRQVDKKSDAFKSLMLSIAKEGQLMPISVFDLGKGRYELIDGSHRFMAMSSLGKVEIEAIVRPYDPNDSLRLQLVYNTHRVEMNPVDIGSAIKKIIKKTDISLDELSKQLRLQRVVLERYILISSCKNKKIIEAVHSGKLSIANAIILLECNTMLQQELLPIAKIYNSVDFRELVLKIKRKSISDRIVARDFILDLIKIKRKFRGFPELDKEINENNFFNQLLERGLILGERSAWNEALKWVMSMDYYGKNSLKQKTKIKFNQKFLKEI